MSVDAIETPPPKTRTLKANFAINMAGALVPLAVSLVTVPIYIRHIGDARYGVLSIVWVLLGYFGFLDLGLSRAAANALARLRDAPQEARARVLVTTLVLNLGMGIIGSLVLALAGSYLLQHVLNVPEALKPEIASAFPWIIALFPLALVSGVGIGTMESREDFLRANIFQIAGSSLGQVVPMLLAVAIEPSLAIVIPTAAIVRGLTAVFIVASAVWVERPLKIKHFCRGEIPALLRFGGWVSVSGIVGPLLISADQFVIGSVAGVAAVAHYAVPMALVYRSQIPAAALSRTAFPRLSALNGVEARELACRALMSVMLGYAVICAPAMLLFPACLKAWLGEQFASDAAPVAVVLLFGAWFNSPAFILHAFLQSQSQPRIAALVYIAELAPYVLVLYLLTEQFGILGSSAAWTLRTGVDAYALLTAAKINLKELRVGFLPLAIVVSSAAFALLCPTSFLNSLLLAAITSACCAALALRFSPEFRSAVSKASLVASGLLSAARHSFRDAFHRARLPHG